MFCFMYDFVKYLFFIYIISFLYVFDELCINEIRYFILYLVENNILVYYFYFLYLI